MFQKIIKNYQKKLVNLSGSNRSLLLLKLSKENDLDLHDTDFLFNKPSFNLIANLIAGKQKFPVCQFLDSRNEKVNLTGKQLQKINRKNNFLIEESGSKDLYVGWPFVHGTLHDGSLIRCPLLFFPVELILESNIWHLAQRKDETLTFNKSFLTAWKHFNKTSLPEDFENVVFDPVSADPLEFRTQLYELLKSNGLEINFNQDLFIDKLQYFNPYSREDFVQLNETGRLKLFNEAVLGIFPQAGSYLLPDYEILAEEDRYRDYDDFFNKRIIENKLNNLIKEADILTPLVIDSPQEEAIKMVKAGHSLVVQGPPGTGKSQLICNLVADFISKGKRALVVCQKKAALDVVYNRLNAAGAGTFVALVHDFKADRSRLYQQAAKQIESVEEYKNDNNQLNTVFLERDFKDACRKIDQISEDLQEFKRALYNTEDCGYSVKELYLTSDHSQQLLPLAGEYYKSFKRDNFKSFTERLKYLLPCALQFENPSHLWVKRKNFKHYSRKDKAGMTTMLFEIQKFNAGFKGYKETFKLSTYSFHHLEIQLDLFFKTDRLSGVNIFEEHFLRYISQGNNPKKIRIIRKKANEILDAVSRLESKKFVHLDNGLSSEQMLLITNQAIKHYQSFLSRLFWNVTSGHKKILFNMLSGNRLSFNLAGLTELKEGLTATIDYHALLNKISGDKDFQFIHEPFNSFKQRAQYIKEAIITADEWFKLSSDFIAGFISADLEKNGFRNILKKLTDGIQQASEAYKIFGTYFMQEHLNEIFEKEDITHYIKSLDHYFDAIAEFDREKESLFSYEALALQDILSAGLSSESATEDLIYAFENSVRRLWIDFIESKNPQLSIVSTTRIHSLERELNEAIQNKRLLSGNILLLRLREQVYKNEEYNRLGNRTTFRDLHHQVKKKKKIWPLRKTIENFREELFSLMPCWLASPETVSAIFPLKEIFDIVIFDEASQCFAEKGIPAIARAKQVVITGDDKQLPPGDLYTIRYDDDTDVPETEIVSMLNLASRFLPQVMLTEHYRSQSLDLIDFSNQHFYQGKLRLLPDFNSLQSLYKGIEYRKVEGVFEGRQNINEALAVVEICLELFQKNPEKEIGVITFNLNQQNLIQDLIERRMIIQNKTVPDTFMIKNIENIQGDEKDIIIFSIGYAPDSTGKMNHYFGSLNQDGGENRLNVAITRAKEKIIVVSSIYPQTLNVENTQNQGPKLLKKYLEYALNVSEGRFKPTLNLKKDFRPDWFLKEKLKLQGKYQEDLPFADLTERNEKGDIIRLLLTDDDKFYRSINIKESFCYFPIMLKAKNWNYKRVYSRNFNKEKDSIA